MIKKSICAVGCAVTCVAMSGLASASKEDGLQAFDREDYPTARQLLAASAQSGDAVALFRMAQMLRYGWGGAEDLPQALALMRKSAEAGSRDAQAELGRMYREGRGVAEDHTEATKWLARAAERGSGVAQLNLARAYRAGQGVPKDFVQAYKWFTLAAGNGFVDGISNRNALADRMEKADIESAEAEIKKFKVKE